MGLITERQLLKKIKEIWWSYGMVKLKIFFYFFFKATTRLYKLIKMIAIPGQIKENYLNYYKDINNQ